MKRLNLIFAILFFFSGCSPYKATNYEVSPTGNIIISDDKGEKVSERDLIGKYCKTELYDGAVIEGRIQKISFKELTILNDAQPSALESKQKTSVVVTKTDISTLTVLRDQGNRNVGIEVVLGLVIIPIAIAFFFIFGGAGG